jgi:solute carrier family 25 phosphate transporter 3
MLGGVLACGLTHAIITPLDVTKCNMQVNPGKYKGLVSGLKTIAAEEGGAAVWKGWFPTLVGYSLQGAFKYGLYEFFKDTYANALGEDNYKKYKPLVWCAGSASAEVFLILHFAHLRWLK